MHKTILDGRELWFDGISSISPEDILAQLSLGTEPSKLCVSHITTDIAQYNKFATPSDKIQIKTSCNQLDLSWNIPDQYNNMCIQDCVLDALCVEFDTQNISPDSVEGKDRMERCLSELSKYSELNLTHILRVLIYVINTLHTNNIVWGVGRGSSVASYILYLLGIHDIDSVKYKLNIDDFLR